MKPWTQDAIAAELEIGQSALNQYLGGKIPINGPVLLKFCELLGCQPEEISQAVAEQERAYALRWLNPASAPRWPFTGQLLSALEEADAETVRRAENGARSHLDLPPLPKPTWKRTGTHG